MTIIIYDDKPGGEILQLNIGLPMMIVSRDDLHRIYHKPQSRLRDILYVISRTQGGAPEELDKLTDLILRLDWPGRREKSIIELYIYWNVITLRKWPRMRAECRKIIRDYPDLKYAAKFFA